MPVLRDFSLAIEADNLLRAQGADPQILRARRPAIVRAAEHALETGKHLLEPRVLYEVHPLGRVLHDRLELQNGKKLTGPLICAQLASAVEIIAMVCTVGERLERQAAEMGRSDLLGALALDALGSAAAEVLAVAACNRLEAETAARGWKISMPLNPGMTGWSVEEGQKEIFALLDASQIGVQLTESRLMRPLKSISLVLGLGPNLDRSGKPCDFCVMSATCRYQDHYA